MDKNHEKNLQKIIIGIFFIVFILGIQCVWTIGIHSNIKELLAFEKIVHAEMKEELKQQKQFFDADYTCP